jgi:hypothetical protein
MKDKPLSEKREEVKKFLEAYMNDIQVDMALRMIKNQDREAIGDLKRKLHFHMEGQETEFSKRVKLEADNIIDEVFGDFK